MGEFHDILTNIVNRCRKGIANNVQYDKAKVVSPRINKHIFNKIAERKKLYRTYTKKPYDINFKKYYKHFCDSLKEEFYFVKNSITLIKLENGQDDPAQQWKV